MRMITPIRVPSISLARAARVAAGLALVAAPAAAQDASVADVEGFHEATTCEVVNGWVWDPAEPGRRVGVDVYLDEGMVATLTADQFRPDLLQAGKGDGAHAFRWALPAEVRASSPRLLELRVAGTDRRLQSSPRVLTCGEDGSGDVLAPVAVIPPVEGAGPSAPDGGEPAPALPKSIRPIRVEAVDRVVLDGRLDDPVWAAAVFRDDFQQKGTERGYDRAERTAVAFAYDDEALWVAARMERSGDGRVRTALARRDDPGSQERILVSLDTRGDRRTAYTFGVTAGGIRVDHVHPQDYEHRVDASFDPVWDARTAVDAEGWTAEMRIPFSQLRFPPGDLQRFGLNVRRWDPATQLNVYWVVVPIAESGWASRFGELTDLEGVSPSHRLEIVPYALGGLTRTTGYPGEPEEETVRRFGGDATVGLGPNVDLDLTVRPDFGQVEADPAEVNLAQFETWFEERRPFFAEEAHLFETEGPRWFYSRRIGSVPVIQPGARLLTQPLSATVLGAAKLAGRVGANTSLAALAALSAPERVRGVDASGTERDVEVIPRTLSGVGRVRMERPGSGSALGFLVTGVHRSFGEPALEGSLASEAVAGGADWRLRTAEGRYVLTGHVGFSHVRGDTAAILKIQRSAPHLFQRPDAGHVEVDPTRTSLSGYTAGLRLAKEAGEHWLWDLGGSWESPGFEIRDAGAFVSADDIEADAALRYRWMGGQGAVRDGQVALFGNAGWNNEGIRTFARPGLFLNATWRNLWRTYLEGGVDLPSLSDDLARGGPLMATPLGWSVGGGVGNNFASPAHWTLTGDYYGDENGGWSYSVYASATAIVFPWLTVGAIPGLSRSDASRQFYGSIPGGGEATFGRRYLFADLERQELSAQLRASISPVPDLTLDLYAEPFVSSGRYHGFGELVAPRTDDVRVYGTDGTAVERQEDGSIRVTDGEASFVIPGADFDVRSFRSTAVLKWEWRAGSNLYLIWQQNRSAYEARWDTAEPAELVDAVSDPGEHVFTAKLTWWLGFS